jgi:ubiquinone/menaquinone biosynthesis C-methylase UbiE
MTEDAKTILAQCGIAHGAHVADFGAGSGYYTFGLAEIVGKEGKVFAVEVQKELMQRVVDDAHGRGYPHVTGVWGDIERHQGTKLRDNSLDAVVVANVLFQVDMREGLLKEVGRVLKPQGKIIFIDWSEPFAGIGPAPADVISSDEAKRLLEQNQFEYLQDISVGRYHYGLLARKR